MRSVELGRSGLRVSELGLGLASLAGMFAVVPEGQAVATIDRTPQEITEVAAYLDHTIPPAYWRALEQAGLIPLRSA